MCGHFTCNRKLFLSERSPPFLGAVDKDLPRSAYRRHVHLPDEKETDVKVGAIQRSRMQVKLCWPTSKSAWDVLASQGDELKAAGVRDVPTGFTNILPLKVAEKNIDDDLYRDHKRLEVQGTPPIQ